MTPSGIEPATFRFVAQHLDHYATAVPHTALYFPFSDHQGTNDVEETEDLESFFPQNLGKICNFLKQFFILWVVKQLRGGYEIRIVIYKLHTND